MDVTLTIVTFHTTSTEILMHKKLLTQNGGTPLLYAVRGNHLKCVEALLSKSVNTYYFQVYSWWNLTSFCFQDAVQISHLKQILDTAPSPSRLHWVTKKASTAYHRSNFVSFNRRDFIVLSCWIYRFFCSAKTPWRAHSETVSGTSFSIEKHMMQRTTLKKTLLQ